MSVPILTVQPDEVHVWLTFPERVTDERVLAQSRAVLTAEEHAATGRFVFDRHRHQHLITRALVRDLLSRYTGESPTAWQFERNPYGRPEIAGPGRWRHLRFNLSHTDGLIACAVTIHRDVGVDVEPVGRSTDVLDIAPRVFSPRELDDLRRLEPDRQRERFFTLWTLKEAYIKARGMGLSLPLDKFTFTVAEDQPVGIDIDPALEDDPATWQFERGVVEGRHAIALAVRRSAEDTLRISYAETVPFVTNMRSPLRIG